jgi:hypothetical protein
MFSNREIVIATMHKKEQVIGPLFKENFNSDCLVPEGLNTDAFGTFSGEVKRIEDPLASARKKCKSAMDQTGCDLSVASEGSFGNHPTSFFTKANDEVVLLVDKKNNIEIFGRALSTNTNFNGLQIQTLEEAFDFAQKVGFPSHGLIIRDKKNSNKDLLKGIIDPAYFSQVVTNKLKKSESIWIETDMRAIYNPTRMTIIQKATENLIAKIKSECPSCQHPGFWVTDFIKGLPCSLCRNPTKSVLTHIYSCVKCDYNKLVEFPQGLKTEDPEYCDFCNP